MKKTIMLLVALSVVTVVALPVAQFENWNNLVEKSPDIMVARCIATQDQLNPKPVTLFGNTFSSDVEVITVIKGSTKPGFSHLSSLYQPYRGELFLALGTYITNQTTAPFYNVIEDYRIVPIRHFFASNELAGKAVEEQVQMILRNRLADLNQDQVKQQAEKIRIEHELGMTNVDNSAGSTRGSTSQPFSPQAGGSF